MKEVWKDIEGYEGLYQISNLGNVKSLKNNIILKPLINKGYSKCHLYKDGKLKLKRIHRLVAETFIPNNNNYPCVNHKDGNKQNNIVDNLEWCTRSYNDKEAYRLGLRKYNKADSKPKKVNQYDLNGNFIKTWKSAKEIKEELNIPTRSISAACIGTQKTCRNFIWKYI